MSQLTKHDKYIREALAAGTSQRNVAKSLGVGTSTVNDYVNSRKIPVPPRTVGRDTPAPIEAGVSREQILEQQVRELRAAMTRTTKSDVAEERVVQAIESAVASTSPPREVFITEPTIDPAEAGAMAHHRQVLVLSDFHGGEVVEPEAVNYLNAYSWEIMQQRVDQLVEAALSHKRNSPYLTGLDVIFAGDMCSGSNHDELAQTNEFPLAEQAIRIGHLQADIIKRLHPHYESLRVLVIVGNHPRLQHKPAAKRVYDNGDWIAGRLMAETLKHHPNIEVVVPRAAAHLWKVAGRTLYVWHGDGVRSTMAGVPWGGVMRRTNEIQAAHRQPIDHFVLGHYHQPNVVQGGRVIMNGSLKGTDEWVQKSFGGGAKPTQLLLTFDERKQRLTDVKFITPTAGVPE